jgi:hypothetical protein
MAIRIPLDHRPAFIQADQHLAHSDEVQISCYDNEVPAFAGAEIDRLYGHLYASPSYFDMAKELAGASTYVARKHGVPVAVFLYRRTERQVNVISEYIKVDGEEVRRFADHVFNSFEPVKVISFGKLQTDVRHLAYPWHALACAEDMVVNLPPTVKEYETAVGKNMRRNIKRYTNALVKDFPSYRYRLYLEDEVSEQHIRDIIALSCTRMKSKNIEPRFTEAETQWIADYAKKCGIVGVATIDDRVCAGAIGFRIGQNYFMHVIAHDVRYNDYSLGILCYYHTICEGIVRAAKRFHLLQGRYGYKYRLLAERQDYVHLDIYRRRVDFILHGPGILKKELKGRIWLAKQWLLHDIERKESAAYRYLARAVGFLRTLKRSKRHGEID